MSIQNYFSTNHNKMYKWSNSLEIKLVNLKVKIILHSNMACCFHFVNKPIL